MIEETTLWAILIGLFVVFSCGLVSVELIFSSLSSLFFPKKKLHVKYRDPLGNNILNQIILSLMPKSMIIKGMAPKTRPLDVFEVLQEDPYEIKELEKNKVWIVSYTHGGGDPSEGKAFGMDDDDKTFDKILGRAKREGEEKEFQFRNDWKKWKEYFQIDPKDGLKGEYCRKVKSKLNMVVVKLRSGDILLYCPVVVHNGTSLDNFLKDLGPVKYIVIGSCYHTSYLPETTKRYPDAKVIGTTPAEIKLNVVNALVRKKLDYNVLDDDQFNEACKILNKEGVDMYFSKHEVMTNSIFLVAYSTGCEVDLVYAHHDRCKCGYKYSWCPSNTDPDPEDFFGRIFKYLVISKPDSPNGKLAIYRFSAMDPAGSMSCISYPSPNRDGTSCIELARFLRKIIKVQFHQVASVHSHVQTSEDFKKSIDAAWNWLDDRSLLPLVDNIRNTMSKRNKQED